MMAAVRRSRMARSDRPTADATACCTAPGIANVSTNQPAGLTCPRCGVRGKSVDTQTLKAMLAISLAVIRPVEYRFCRTVQCPIVYFSSDGLQTFTERALRERVYQKHPDDDAVFVCYCFRHTPGAIRAELWVSRVSTTVERVNAGIATGQCACDIRNPQGNCCLGNVATTVKRIKVEMKQVQVKMEPMAIGQGGRNDQPAC